MANTTRSAPSSAGEGPQGPDADQLKFCQARDGNVRLLAPAGCGKTQALLWRCRYLAEQSAKEKPRFLIFTFTRAARDELNDRLRTHFPDIAPVVNVTTLNAWGNRKLKEGRHNARLRKSQSERRFDLNNVLQPIWSKHKRLRDLFSDNRGLYRYSQAIIEHMDMLKTLAFRHDRIKTKTDLTAHLGFLERSGTLPRYHAILQRLTDMEILHGEKDRDKAFMEHFFRFWQEACEHLRASALFCYEDQKYWTWIELEEQLSQRRHWSGAARYRYIMVDEFQDINPLDLELIKTISELNRAELTLIGDDDQAIFEWRGATPEFILKPASFLGHSYSTFILGTNYRSPKNIVELSQRLIVHNHRREPKQVRAHRSEEADIQVLQMRTLSESIDYVLQLVRQSQAAKDCRRLALIGRKRAQIIPYQIVFAGHDIPFYAAEDLHVFLSETFTELKEMLAIRVRANVSGMLAGNPAEDLLKLCDRVKRFRLAKAEREALRASIIKQRPSGMREAVRCLRGYTGDLKGANSDGRMSSKFADAVDELLDSKTVAQAISVISELFEGLQRDYGKSIEDIFYADPPFLHLSDYAMRYGTDFERFYADLDKAMATLVKIPPEEDEHDDEEQGFKLPLHLMTALRAKGKEFDTVVILDANEGIWPGQRAQTEEELEQERRLFYVAATRARKRLVMLVNQLLLDKPSQPSRYLAEMGLSPRRPSV